MKALFVHDHIFLKTNDGSIYSPGGFPRELWSKYTIPFDTLTVLSRGYDFTGSISQKHILSAGPKDDVDFIFVDSISGIKNRYLNFQLTHKQIENAVKDSDIVIARLPSENSLEAIKLSKKYNKKLIVEVVGCIWDGLWNYGSLSGKLYAPIAYFRMRNAVRFSNNILYVTNQFLQSRYPHSPTALTVSASNVNVDTSGKLPTKKVNSKLVLGLIGNYKTNYKGIDTALAAMVLLNYKIKDFEFRVLGNGNPSDYLEYINKKGLDGKVKFYDPLPSGRPVLEWLDEIDIYIQPSRQEGLPRSLIEAMSRGCLCIGSEAGGIPELLESQYIHKTGSGKSLFNRIDEHLHNAYLCERNIEAAKQYDSKLINSKRNSFFLTVREGVE